MVDPRQRAPTWQITLGTWVVLGATVLLALAVGIAKDLGRRGHLIAALLIGWVIGVCGMLLRTYGASLAVRGYREAALRPRTCLTRASLWPSHPAISHSTGC